MVIVKLQKLKRTKADWIKEKSWHGGRQTHHGANVFGAQRHIKLTKVLEGTRGNGSEDHEVHLG